MKNQIIIDPKFHNKDLSNTFYAFNCGYIQRYAKNNDSVTLEYDNIFHLKTFINGVLNWITFEPNEMTIAKKEYKKEISKLNKGN